MQHCVYFVGRLINMVESMFKELKLILRYRQYTLVSESCPKP